MARTLHTLRSGASRARAVSLIRRWSEPLPPLADADAFGAMFDRFGHARVVLLGEASHGTSEFYRARSAITRRLIEHHGFTIVAVEADWPDAAAIDAHVRHRGVAGDQDVPFTRFPTWMWRNTDVQAFAGWLRNHNAGLDLDQRVEFRGLDIYSLAASIRAILGFLDKADPDEAREARKRYACLTPWQNDPSRYGRLASRGKSSCADEVADEMHRLLDRRLRYLGQDDTFSGQEALLGLFQNARVVHAAEAYYRAGLRSDDESWNLRDKHMFDTLRHMMASRGPEAKVVVWAHNSHVGDAGATEMGWRGQSNLGRLCRDYFKSGAALIGCGTDRGTVLAAHEWGGRAAVKRLAPVREDSHECLFREAAYPRSLTHWAGEERRALRESLAEPALERGIGVLYRPDTERESHYFEALLARQFDAWIWLEKTTAVEPLPALVLEAGPVQLGTQ